MQTNKEERVLNYYVLCNKLKDVIRTGWKTWNVKRDRLESVAEHVYGVQMLAIAMKSEYSYDIDINKDNYSEYFGNTYLDEGRILQGRIIVIVVSTMLFIVGIMLFIGFIREMKIIRLEKKNTYKKIVRKD